MNGAAVVAAEAIRVRVPFRRPGITSAGTWTHRESWIVRLFDGGGAVGLGEAALDFDAGDAAAELARLVRLAVEGVRARDRLPTSAELDASGAAGRALRCAIDSALLDLRLREAPRAEGPRSVPVNATIGFLGASESAAAARAAVTAGFRTIKMKVGPERTTVELIERVAAVRHAIGPDVRLRLDVNGAAHAFDLHAVAEFRPEYVEQPVDAGDLYDLIEARGHSPVPIAADESVSSVAAARELLAAGAADVLVVKPARVGGPFAAWEIEELAGADGVPVVISTLFETGVGIAAALATAAGLAPVAGPTADLAHGLATADLLESDLLVHSLKIEHGRMFVPEGPGLGIELDEAALRRYAVERLGSRP